MPRPMIMVSPTGARRQKCDHPGLPVTVAEIAAAARACADAGADAIHLHIRDGAGAHSLDAGLYREALAAVAEAAPGLERQITTEAAGRFTPADQLGCLKAVRPDYASAAIRELTQDGAAAREFYGFAAAEGIRLQHILYDASDVVRLREAFANGLVPEDAREAIFVLGTYQPPRAGAPDALGPLLAAADGLDLDWMVCAFGPTELACLSEALHRGGHVRVGFENNIHHPDGRLADSIEAQVAAIAAIRREIFPHEETRP